MAAVAFVAAAIQFLVYLTSSRSTDGGGTLGTFVRSAPERVAGMWIFGTREVFGEDGLLAVKIISALWIIVVLALTAVVLGRAVIAPWITFFGLLAVVTNAYGNEFVSGPITLGRHVLTPLAIALILLVATVCRARSKALAVVAILCIAAGVFGIADTFLLVGYLDPGDMAGLEQCVDAGQPVCITPIYPPGWFVTLTR